MSANEPTFSSVASTNYADRHILAKVTRRLIPFLFTCFVLNYIDRINVGFAKLHFQDSLGFSDAVYGLGVSLFFVGYLFFEVPSNLLLARFGARKTLARIMSLWGLVSISRAPRRSFRLINRRSRRSSPGPTLPPRSCEPVD